MTNRNPASSYGNSSDVSKEILARVNAHADRSLDRIFADIDDLLNDDLDNPTPSDPQDYHHPYQFHSNNSPQYPHEPVLPNSPAAKQPESDRQYPPQSHFEPPTPPQNPPEPSIQEPAPKKTSFPLWMKALLGIGITAVAASSLLLWLINTQKIALPKSFNLSWLPFQSSSSISADDAKFAEYMRKSIAKIDAANSRTATDNTVANPITNSISQPNNTASSSPGSIASTIPATIPVSLIKILPGGDRPGAEFEVKGKVQKVYAGEKIADSNWSLVTVAKGEVIVKKVSGEIRSVYVGQKF
jgi:hypothetical protein